MIRIIAGRSKGRRLTTFKGADLRPTSERVREAIFDMLPPMTPGDRVLDLFAGTGGLGLEALSRGAGFALFVDRDPRAVATIEKNLRLLGTERGRVLRADAFQGLERLSRSRYHVIFADPPYRFGDRLCGWLERLSHAALLEPGGWLVLEHHKKFEIVPPDALRPYRLRRYGDTAVSIFTASQEGS